MAHEAGRSLLPEALIDNIFAGPFVLRSLVKSGHSGGAVSILKDRLRAAIALSSGPAPLSISVKGDSCIIDGQAQFVRGAACADCVLVIGDQSVAVLDLLASTKQVTIAAQVGLDSSIKLGAITFTKAKASLLNGIDSAALRALLLVLRACEVSGACEKVVELTVEYVKTRKQFDLPVGGFQAVQHRLADMHLQAEAISAASYFGSWAADYDPKQLSFAARAAIAYACEQGPEIIEGAIQLHGGIGFTWEFDLHLYLRRVRAISALYGFDDQGYIDLLGLVNSA